MATGYMGFFEGYTEIYELTMLFLLHIVSTDLFDHFQNTTENHIPLSSNPVGFGSAYIWYMVDTNNAFNA